MPVARLPLYHMRAKSSRRRAEDELRWYGHGKVVECDCEKEWWDKLEWDDGSQASRYKPIHSRYYKKTMLRGSVLR